MPEQINYLFEGRMLGQVMYVVSGIDKLAFVSIYVAYARLGGNYSFEASLGYVGFTRHLPVPFSLNGGIEIILDLGSEFKNRTRVQSCQRSAHLRRQHGCDYQWDFDIDNGPRSNEFIRL